MLDFTNNGVVAPLIGDHGAPAVSLARVLPSVRSTDHVRGDLWGGVEGVGCSALGVGHGVHINLEREGKPYFKKVQQLIHLVGTHPLTSEKCNKIAQYLLPSEAHWAGFLLMRECPSLWQWPPCCHSWWRLREDRLVPLCHWRWQG